MGNRATITTPEKQTAIYLHWNGGRDSVEAFLKYCELRGFRSDDYGLARLTQVIGNFFGGGLSIGIGTYASLKDAGDDNGVYVVDDWKIIERIYPYDGFEEQQSYDLAEMLKGIDAAQPESERLGAYLDAVEFPAADLVPGDVVFVPDFLEGGRFTPYTVMGRAEYRGESRPYVNKYDHDGDFTWNQNNFIRDEVVRVASFADRPEPEPEPEPAKRKAPKCHNRARHAARSIRL